MTELTLALNFIIIFLLVTAIIYGFVLNRRIKLIRDSGRELAHLFRSFDDTILKAQESIGELKRVSGEISGGLQKKIDKAALIMDDLEFLGEKATNAAGRASAVIENFRKIENKIQEIEKKQTVAAMPLMTTPHQSKSVIPARPAVNQKHKALESLLEEVSAARNNIQLENSAINNNVKIMAKPLAGQEENNVAKRQFSIANALKAMGYGD